MDSEETDLNPNPVDSDSAPKKSVDVGKSEDRVEKDPSYMRSRRIALKKFTPPEGEPS